jgi:hypothetical protein
MATELQTVRTTEREFFDAFEFVAPSVQIDRLMQWLAEQGDDVEDVTRFSGGRVVWTMSPVRFPLEAVVFSVGLRLSVDNAAVVNALAEAYHHCLAVVLVRGP